MKDKYTPNECGHSVKVGGSIFCDVLCAPCAVSYEDVGSECWNKRIEDFVDQLMAEAKEE